MPICIVSCNCNNFSSLPFLSNSQPTLGLRSATLIYSPSFIFALTICFSQLKNLPAATLILSPSFIFALTICFAQLKKSPASEN